MHASRLDRWIKLAAVGAILAFAVTDNINNVDLTMVGYILMAAGVVGLIWSIWLVNAHRNTTRRVVEDRHIHDDRV